MIDWLHALPVLAEEEAQRPQQGPDLWALLFLFLGVFLLWQLIMNPQRREKRRMESLLQSLKKNDRIVTYSGILGTVAAIAPEKGEVTVKVDENVRIRMRLEAIHSVIKEEGEDASKDKESDKA